MFPVIKIFPPIQAAYIWKPGKEKEMNFILGYYTFPFHSLIEWSFQAQNI